MSLRLESKTQWIVDKRINVTLAAQAAKWHRQSTIDAIVNQGLTPADAAAFTQFVFDDHAEIRDEQPEDAVTDEQWARLSVKS